MFKKNKSSKLKSLKVGRFAFNTWMKCNPDSNIHEWEESQKPYSLTLYIMSILNKICFNRNITIEDLDAVQIVTLDENYTQFLKENNLADSVDVRSQYFLTEDEANDILRKNKLDKDLQVMVIGVVVSSREEKDVLAISKETKDYIQDCLSKLYGEVWFPGYLMTAEDVENESERLISMADQYFEKKQKITLSKYEDITVEGCDGTTIPMDFTFIPFVVNGPNRNAFFSMKEFEKNLYEMHKQVTCEEKTEIEKMLRKDFSMRNTMIFSHPLFPDQTVELIESYCKVLKNCFMKN